MNTQKPMPITGTEFLIAEAMRILEYSEMTVGLPPRYAEIMATLKSNQGLYGYQWSQLTKHQFNYLITRTK